MGKSGAARTLSLTIAAIALTVAPIAGATVYKCTGPAGAVTYQDFPCKRGAVVEIRSGTADPGAIDRLDQQNAAFDRNMAARAAIEQSAADRRQELNLRRQELEATQAAAVAAPGYVPAYGYAAPFVKRHAIRPRPRARIETVPQGRVPAEIRRPHPG